MKEPIEFHDALVSFAERRDIKMILSLKIPNNGEFRLEFDGKLKRFSMCKFIYLNGESQIQIYEDYIYFFIENMLGRIKNIPVIKQKDLFGVLGKWQEYFYFDNGYAEEYSHEIEIMEKSIFISAECYGIFLYEYDNIVWIEFNKSYNETESITPLNYYSDFSNYRILLAALSKNILFDWKSELETIQEQLI